MVVNAFLSPSDVTNHRVGRTWLFQPGSFPCGANLCSVCKFSIKTKKLFSSDHRKEILLQNFVNCNTTYVVYAVHCKQCDLLYVGCTKRKLRTRIKQHIADINANKEYISRASNIFVIYMLAH